MDQRHPSPAGLGAAQPRLIEFAPLARRVSVWRCDLREAHRMAAAVAEWLSPEEHARAARFGTAELRERYITGRAGLRRALTAHIGGEPASVSIARGARGRPELAEGTGPDFNVTHTADSAVFAIGYGLAVNERVGIDVESSTRTLNVQRLARKLLTDSERRALAVLGDDDLRRLRFLATWTCKEAMSKATAEGLRAPFRQFAVEPEHEPRVLAGPSPYSPDAWQLHRVPVGDDLIVTVALWQR